MAKNNLDVINKMINSLGDDQRTSKSDLNVNYTVVLLLLFFLLEEKEFKVELLPLDNSAELTMHDIKIFFKHFSPKISQKNDSFILGFDSLTG